MNKKKFGEDIFSRIKYTKEQREILKGLESAMQELKDAREFFQIAHNPDLIDYAIYREAAAQAKYIYLLNEAKNKNIKVNSYLLVENNEVV
ncbi:DUF2508 family protein [Haloimpatiens massiliensis]|uniref:DUF2508 family protein n=1 Tax=Haloimpatiens massiliensis TaxID=1658110 RepID=UPI000C85E0A3|nr:DUF2508 family protein [Haloimpatiens massiliensis]